LGKLARRLLSLGLAAALLLIILLIWSRWQVPAPEAPPEEGAELESWRQTFSETDLDLLARVVRAEAEGEPFDGQVAVAAVILNRVKHPEFPNTIPGVVYEPLAFSVVANGTVNNLPMTRPCRLPTPHSTAGTPRGEPSTSTTPTKHGVPGSASALC